MQAEQLKTLDIEIIKAVIELFPDNKITVHHSLKVITVQNIYVFSSIEINKIKQELGIMLQGWRYIDSGLELYF